MGEYTRFGVHIWSWEPFLSLVEDDGYTPDYRARNLWVGLYTSAEMRRTCPGLFNGSIGRMAEAARMPGDDARYALDKLLLHDLVEYDDHAYVLRMTHLPDALDGCDNGNVIRGWFGRFKTVPSCVVRDSHIRLLRWMLDETNKLSSKKKGIQGREEAWAETFGTIPLPAIRRRGIRRLIDNGTGTVVQPGLFDAPSRASRALPAPSEPFLPASETVSGPTTEGHLADSSNSSKTLIRETVPEPFGNGLVRIQDQDLGLGKSDPDPGPAAIENAHRRPALTLVPPFAPEQLVAGIVAGMGEGFLRVTQTVRQTLGDALRATIRALDDMGWGVAEVALAGKWLASSHGRHQLRQISTGCPPDEVVSVWASSPSDVIAAIQNMAEQERAGADRAAFLASLTR